MKSKLDLQPGPLRRGGGGNFAGSSVVALGDGVDVALDEEVAGADPPPGAPRPRLGGPLVERLPTCPMPEIAGLGRTLRTWKNAHLASFDTGGASNTPHRSHQQT